ncbi:MAG: hypothetical protein JWO31_3693 [Phycisphaerales bacterium]|nr:hypothetical protein [Phycisphaerales bacterium]
MIEPLEPRRLRAATFYVAPRGDDANAGTDATLPWRHVQRAFDVATPGSTVLVAPGVYREKVDLHVSGSAADESITFRADGLLGSVVLSGKGVRGANLVHIQDRSYVRIEGFELRDNLGVRDGSGIRIEGTADHVELNGNRVHRIRGRNAMGITIYGSNPASGVHDLTIDGNEVYDCQAAPSEAVTLNGNVSRFAVTNNVVHDVNNIGIDFIGGEGVCPDPALDAARDGVCAGNRVDRARSNYGGGYAAGVYVDGGRNLVLERNTVTRSDVGIEVGCEHAGRTVTGVVVRDNVLAGNGKAGLGFGGYAESVGQVSGCTFTNNTLVHNGRRRPGSAGGEIWVQLGSGNVVRDNLVVAWPRGTAIDVEPGGEANALAENWVLADGGTERATFVWAGDRHRGYADYLAAGGADLGTVGVDPLLVDMAGGDFRLAAGSPAVDAGDPAFTPAAGETDADGGPRVRGGRVDAGAYEVG